MEGYLLAADSGHKASKKAVEIAKHEGTRVALSFSDSFVVNAFDSCLRELVAQSDLVFSNLAEAQKFTRCEDPQEAFQSLCKEVPQAVVTLGAEGALVYFDGVSSRISAVETQPIDATGAGDMFAGGFLYGITHGMTGMQAGELACHLASKVVSQLGPRLKGDLISVLN